MQLDQRRFRNLGNVQVNEALIFFCDVSDPLARLSLHECLAQLLVLLLLGLSINHYFLFVHI